MFMLVLQHMETITNSSMFRKSFFMYMLILLVRVKWQKFHYSVIRCSLTTGIIRIQACAWLSCDSTIFQQILTYEFLVSECILSVKEAVSKVNFGAAFF